MNGPSCVDSAVVAKVRPPVPTVYLSLCTCLSDHHCPPVFLSVGLSLCPSLKKKKHLAPCVHLSPCLSIGLYLCLTVCLSIRLRFCFKVNPLVPFRLALIPALHLSICLFFFYISLSVCLSACFSSPLFSAFLYPSVSVCPSVSVSSFSSFFVCLLLCLSFLRLSVSHTQTLTHTHTQ